MILTDTSTFFGPNYSNEGVSQVIVYSFTKTPVTSFSFFPPAENLTKIFAESLKPSPVITHFDFPVNGPKLGLIEKIAYGGPVMVEMFNAHMSSSQVLDHPPWTINLESF